MENASVCYACGYVMRVQLWETQETLKNIQFGEQYYKIFVANLSMILNRIIYKIGVFMLFEDLLEYSSWIEQGPIPSNFTAAFHRSPVASHVTLR